MFRKSLACVVGALALVAMAAAPASAATAIPLPSGQITCGLNGTMTFKKPLPNANLDTTVRNTKIKVTATLVACDNTQVADGKAPITGGTLTIQGFLEPDSSCSDIVDGTPPDYTFDTNVFQVKWTSGVPGGKHPTVGKSKTDIFSTGDFLFGAWEYLSDAFRDTDSFGGESATIDLGITNGVDVTNCGRGFNGPDGQPANLGHVDFSAAQGSRIVVAP